MKNKLARTIRIISVPPIMVSVLIILLYLFREKMFRESSDLIFSIVFLGIIPILAYPFQLLFPKLREMGREGQRKLAFLSNIIGYTWGFIWSIVSKVENELALIFSTYFFSVILLTIFNLVGFKASGHASSSTGPLLIAVFLLGYQAVAPCVVVAILILWASRVLNRHTMKQLLCGVAICVIAFMVSLGFTGLGM